MQEKNPNASYNMATGKLSIVAAGGPACKGYRATSDLPRVCKTEARTSKSSGFILSYRGQEIGGM